MELSPVKINFTQTTAFAAKKRASDSAVCGAERESVSTRNRKLIFMKSSVILVLSSLRAASGFIGFTRFDAPETDGFDVTLNDLQRRVQMQRCFFSVLFLRCCQISVGVYSTTFLNSYHFFLLKFFSFCLCRINFSFVIFGSRFN